MAKPLNFLFSFRLVLLTPLLLASLHAIDSDTKQCDADQAISCGSEAGHNGFTRYETFEDIPQDIVERAHLRELGSHREADAEVEVLDYMISSEDFYERHVARHKPVVLKNVAKRWPATKLWTDEYLKEKYGNLTLNMETRDDNKLNPPESRTVRTFLDSYETADLYMVDEVPPGMRKDVVMPQCLRCSEIEDWFFVSYFWMSTGGTSSTLHIDSDENLLTVIQGKKDVVLISPKYSRDVYADEARVLGVSDVNVSAVDLERFPRVANIRYMTAHLEAGDALYLPQFWWHYVHSPKMRQQAVAMWWKSTPLAKYPTKNNAPSSRQRSEAEESSEPLLVSLARWLEDYISWIDDFDENADLRPLCKNKVKFMSDLGDNSTDDILGSRTSTRKEANSTRDALQTHPCYFDHNNPESPCNYPPCANGTELDESLPSKRAMNVKEEGERVKEKRLCLGRIINYCSRYQDQGCIIELPRLLNKKSHTELFELVALKAESLQLQQNGVVDVET